VRGTGRARSLATSAVRRKNWAYRRGHRGDCGRSRALEPALFGVRDESTSSKQTPSVFAVRRSPRAQRFSEGPSSRDARGHARKAQTSSSRCADSGPAMKLRHRPSECANVHANDMARASIPGGSVPQTATADLGPGAASLATTVAAMAVDPFSCASNYRNFPATLQAGTAASRCAFQAACGTRAHPKRPTERGNRR